MRKLQMMTGVALGVLIATPVLAKDAIKIGLPTSLTGAYVELGEEAKRGAQFAANEANAKGGINGRMVELEFADDEGNPEVGRRAAEKLVRNGYRLLTASISSAVGLAIGAQVEKWDAIYVSAINKSDRLTGEACNPRMFRANHADGMDMAVIAPWIKTRPEGDWAIIAADYAWGRDSAEAFQTAATGVGKTIKGKLFAPLGSKDYAPYIQQIKDMKPAGLWVAVAGRDAVNFGIQAKQFGLLGSTFAVSQSFAVPASIKGMGDVAEGVWGIVNYTATYDSNGNKEFVAAWTKAFGKEPANFEVGAYSAVKLILAAVAKADSIEPEEVAKAMNDVSVDLPMYGRVTMRAADHQLQLPNYIGKVARVNGELKPVVEKAFDTSVAMPPPAKECKL